MNAAEQITRLAIDELQPVLDESGYVLYSDALSLKPCSVYLLGHNPGGSQEDKADATVRASLDALPFKTINNYIDEEWTTASHRSWAKGGAPLQRRVVWLLQQLGFIPRNVPCSNLIFVRSIDVTGSSFKELSDLCWKVHEHILEVAKPKLLLVFGNPKPSPYTYLFEKFMPGQEETFPSGHGNWMCRSFRANGYTVVGLPHLSRYNIIRKSDVVHWIKAHNVL